MRMNLDKYDELMKLKLAELEVQNEKLRGFIEKVNYDAKHEIHE